MHSQPNIASYSLGEAIANSITHGLGLILATIGLVVITVCAVRYGDAWHIVSGAIFASTLVLLYAISTLYHSIPHPRAKEILQLLDHSAIFLLIAGSYTPFTLVSLNGAWGWSLFGIVWGLAVLGIVLKWSAWRRYEWLALSLYLLMGWVVIFAFEPLVTAVDPGGLWLLLFGGIAYTGGIAFYLWEALPFNHAVWHLFVIAGSALHFFAVLFYVIPAPPGV